MKTITIQKPSVESKTFSFRVRKDAPARETIKKAIDEMYSALGYRQQHDGTEPEHCLLCSAKDYLYFSRAGEHGYVNCNHHAVALTISSVADYFREGVAASPPEVVKVTTSLGQGYFISGVPGTEMATCDPQDLTIYPRGEGYFVCNQNNGSFFSEKSRSHPGICLIMDAVLGLLTPPDGRPADTPETITEEYEELEEL